MYRAEAIPERFVNIAITIGASPTNRSPAGVAQYGVAGTFVETEPDGAKLQVITDLIEAGKIKPFVETIFPLSEVRQAHELLQSGRSRGKIVLQVIPD